MSTLSSRSLTAHVRFVDGPTALREHIPLFKNLIFVHLDERNSLGIINGKHVEVFRFSVRLVQELHLIFIRIQLKVRAFVVQLQFLAFLRLLLVCTQIQGVALGELAWFPEVTTFVQVSVSFVRRDAVLVLTKSFDNLLIYENGQIVRV